MFVVIAMTVVQALATMAVVAPASIAPAYAAQLAVQPALIGYQISVAYVAAALSSLMSGGAVLRFGACRTNQISLAFSAAGIALMAVPMLAVAGAGSLLIGLGYGLNNPAASHLLARIASERRRNLVFSIKQTGVPIGVLAAGLVVPPATLHVGWQAAFLIVALLCLAWSAAIQPYRGDWDGDREPARGLIARPFEGFALIVAVRPLRYLSLAAFFYAGLQISLIAYTVTLLVEDLGYGLVQAGLVLSLMQVAGAAGRIVWGWLADRLGHSLPVLAALGGLMTLAALGTGLMSPAWPAFAVQALLVVFAAAAVGWNGVFIANVARLSPDGHVGSATGGALAVTFSGVVLVPSVMAATYTLVGTYTATFALASVCGALGALLTLTARRHAHRARKRRSP